MKPVLLLVNSRFLCAGPGGKFALATLCGLTGGPFDVILVSRRHQTTDTALTSPPQPTLYLVDGKPASLSETVCWLCKPLTQQI